MPEELLTKDEPTAPESEQVPADELRQWARQHVERVRRLKMHVAVYVVGMLLLTPIWALVEWSDNGGFERFTWNDEGNPGDWEPWLPHVALIVGLIVGISAVRFDFDRPTTEAGFDREIDRLRSRR